MKLCESMPLSLTSAPLQRTTTMIQADLGSHFWRLVGFLPSLFMFLKEFQMELLGSTGSDVMSPSGVVQNLSSKLENCDLLEPCLGGSSMIDLKQT